MLEKYRRPGNGEKSFEVLDASALGRIIELAKSVSLELSSYLTAPNVILSLAGVKPMADVHVRSSKEPMHVDDDFLEMVSVSNARIHTAFPDIYLTSDGKVTKDLVGTEKSILLRVRNLRGIERVSSMSKLSGMPSFDRSTGIEGAYQWYGKLETNIVNAQHRGELPSGDAARDIILQGIDLGYPDQAILDFVDWYLTGRKKELKKAAFMDAPGGYPTPEPAYLYYPEHASDPMIIENIKTANAVLDSFYKSKEYNSVQET